MADLDFLEFYSNFDCPNSPAEEPFSPILAGSHVAFVASVIFVVGLCD